MDVYRVCFIGQGMVADEDAVRDLLEHFAARLIQEKSFVEFLVTRENRFDAIATSAVRRAQSVYGTKNSCLSLTLAHPIAKNDFFAEYDNVAHSLPLDEAYDTVQNHRRMMIAQSDLVLSYVTENSGEAYHSLKYAAQKSKTVKNLAPLPTGEPTALPPEVLDRLFDPSQYQKGSLYVRTNRSLPLEGKASRKCKQRKHARCSREPMPPSEREGDHR